MPAAPMAPMPSLSIVLPLYNEPLWISVVIDDLVTAIEAAPFTEPEIIVVDDGSDADTRAAAAALSTPFPLRVIRQENQGRFAARKRGVCEAKGDLVLLIDSRVSIRPDALMFVADRLPAGAPLPIWNAHVDVELSGNPFARFWNVLTEVAFAEYFGNPRTTSYGLEEFDRFPKGTTCFLAPRVLLREAIDAFSSAFEHTRDANDDTIIIRALAERQRINISPGFSCLYRSRDALEPFLRHARHRGGVFVDGYGRPGTRFFPVIAAFFPASLLSVVVAIRRPRLGLLGLIGAPLGALVIGVRFKRSAADVATLVALGPMWAVAFASGMWRGLGLAVRNAMRRA
jgi:glycosyltransferase involved in cell wall biosynthesis